MDEAQLEILGARARRSLNDLDPGQVISAWRRIVGPRPEEMSADALAAKEALQNGEVPTPTQLQALERVIRMLRPALLVQERQVGPIEHEAEASFPEWAAFRPLVRRYLGSVGRIDSWEFRGGVFARTTVATGFAVGPHAVLTNSHVVDQLTAGSGVLAPEQTQIRFGEEFGRTRAAVAQLTAVRFDDPVRDLAVLETQEALNEPPFELTMIGSPAPSPKPGDPVAAVGYPMRDPRAPDYLVGQFNDRYDVERVSPGVVIRTFSGSLMNDCSMLNGSSGSPLFGLSDAAFVGVHRGGFYLASNTAVAGEALAGFFEEHLQ